MDCNYNKKFEHLFIFFTVRYSLTNSLYFFYAAFAQFALTDHRKMRVVFHVVNVNIDQFHLFSYFLIIVDSFSTWLQSIF